MDIYTNPSKPGSFSGISGFKKNNPNINVKDIKQLHAYAIHKQVKRKFLRRKTIATSIDECWQIDLIDIKKYYTQNSHFKFVLICIDVLSRYAWARPLKNKESKSCKDAFVSIFEEGRKPEYIYSDLGNEFKGECKKYLKSLGINQVETKSIHKAAIVERFNRTLKNKIARYMTYNKSSKFIDILPDLIRSYNNSFHRSIKTYPSKVSTTNQIQVFQNLYGEEEAINFVYKKGDYVRLINDKKIFQKGYEPNWSEEIYIIRQLNPSNPATYKLTSLEGEDLTPNFYQEELQKAQAPFDTFSVIQEKGDQVQVKQLNSEISKPIWVLRSSIE
jgi:hypothetical protein